MDPSAREKLAVLQAVHATKKREVSQKEAKIAKLKAEVEELRRALQDRPTKSGDA